jgi:P-type E1-E2 ATPase
MIGTFTIVLVFTMIKELYEVSIFIIGLIFTNPLM